MARKRAMDTEEPTSAEEAREWRETLIQENKDIQLQFSDPDKRGSDGERLSGNEYWVWRHAAVAAQRHREKRISYLKSWIRDHVAESKAAELGNVDIHDPKSLLQAAYRILRRVRMTLPDEEQELSHLIGMHLGIE